MACQECRHKSRDHAMGRCYAGTDPKTVNLLPALPCECSGWKPSSGRAADFPCAWCGPPARGWEWINGEAICWGCFRDAERAGQVPVPA